MLKIDEVVFDFFFIHKAPGYGAFLAFADNNERQARAGVAAARVTVGLERSTKPGETEPARRAKRSQQGFASRS
ncbi:hypothetical protein [Jeongeupia sp. USM3]|uniref:hypothetical protein n=1 Tax=Jeongeupia sp. USM3 TaxID=1906741 RepID=UPI0011AB561D|nr:hypothetical protein [Jeongeupia sp. USM3]